MAKFFSFPVVLFLFGLQLGIARADQIPATCASKITPRCLLDLYNIPQDRATLPNNTIAVLGFGGEYANKADLKQFLSSLRADLEPPTTFSEGFVDGGTNSQNATQAGTLANLETQYTVGVASGVPTLFVSSGKSDIFGLMNVVNYLRSQHTVPNVIIITYGWDEHTISRPVANDMCNLFAQLGKRGTTVVVSSGDGGVAGMNRNTECEGKKFVPTFPASCPFVTVVGATRGFQPEIGASLSAGGFSNFFGRPKYQNAAVGSYMTAIGGQYKGRYNANGRAYPDVSAQGMNFQMLKGERWMGVDSTDAAALVFGSTIALLNDKLMAAGKKPVGFLNPLLYQNPSALNDIFTGNNPGCGTTGFSARAGWDPVSGLGTADFLRLGKALGI